MVWEKNPKVRKIIKEISLLTFKDERVVQEIAYHPLLFFKNMMEDVHNIKSVRIRYFGVFYPKIKLSKEKLMIQRFKGLINDIGCVYEVCKEDYPEFENLREFEFMLQELFNAKDWESVNLIRAKYKTWKKNKDVTNTEYPNL